MSKPEALPELWAGVECTVNRVGDAYFDQLAYSGHNDRIEDIDRFAELGIRAMRYPFLWERIAPNGLAGADWKWADERLARLRGHGIRVIAGFVHHGSGPRATDLLDPSFGEKLAEYAAAFAARYPWVSDFTPVNEPGTTARFSALYGVWYPHHKNSASFARALVNECRGTRLAMREIRAVNPAARLIVTEDLGRTSSTPLLAYQAAYENERRYLAFDLLLGRVRPGHPFWDELIASGVPEKILREFIAAPCPPDLIGVNHYLLSNRHLDERLDKFPAWSHGGNGRHAYADVESVRVAELEPVLPGEILREAWQRYGIPLAVTEVHIDGPREEQLRWFMEVWRAIAEARAGGADIRAVTYWGLLGHFDWHCLVARCEGRYEPGVFDLRAPAPRPTALARMIGGLARDGAYDHPVLDIPGWWKRPVRRLYASALDGEGAAPYAHLEDLPLPDGRAPRPLLIAGGRGALGQAFARICEARGLPYRVLGRAEMDIADPAAVRAAFEEVRPWAVINGAGYARVDLAECDVATCFRENAQGPATLAAACEIAQIPFLTFSSHLVFDGAAQRPYLESHGVAPLNVYGRSKAQAERDVRELCERALIVRTSAFFGPWDADNFVTSALTRLRSGGFLRTLRGLRVSPTYLPDLVHAALDLLIDGERGVWHLSNQGEIGWTELALQAAQMAKIDPARVAGRIVEQTAEEFAEELGRRARRPSYSVLGSERGSLLPPLDNALERYLADRNELKCS